MLLTGCSGRIDAHGLGEGDVLVRQRDERMVGRPFGSFDVNDVHPLCAFSTTPHYKGSSACSRGRDREETQPTLRVHARSAKNQHILVVVPASLDVAK